MTLPSLILPQVSLAEASFWMPVQASEIAPRIDWVFYFILGISVFFFVLIMVLMAVFAVKYRARPGEVSQSTISHHTPLETTWSVIPSIIVIVIFGYGFVEYLDVYTPPRDSYEVFVNVAEGSYSWTFTYPNGVVVSGQDGAVFPLNENIRLVMTSEDYIHSFFVPAFRVKRDLMPGRYTHTWFKGTRPTARADQPERPALPLEADEFYHLFCAEYCGDGHSTMTGRIYIWPQEDFDAWMVTQVARMEDPDPFVRGQRLFRRHCAACHTDGEVGQIVGPAFTDLFATDRIMADGTVYSYERNAEEFMNYVRRSILDPAADIVRGYPNTMPTFAGRLSEAEINALIIYFKSISPDENVAREAQQARQEVLDQIAADEEDEANDEEDEADEPDGPDTD